MNQSGKFQGYARMARTSRSDNHGFPWKKSSRMSKETFSRVIKIDWINQYVNMHLVFYLFHILSIEILYHLTKLYI